MLVTSKEIKGAEENGHYDIQSSPMYRFYRGVLIPLLESRKKAWLFLGLVTLLFVLAALLPALRLVPLKLLPYDNKNEFLPHHLSQSKTGRHAIHHKHAG